MDAQESKQKFQQADQLYRAGRYQEALDLLDELNRAYPNAKNVLYPAALCLKKLGRDREALPICEQLIARFQDPRAQELKAKITAGLGGGGDVQSTALADLGLTGASDILGDAPPRRAQPYTPVEEGSDWLKYSLIGLGVVVLLAILIVPPLMYEAPPEPPPGSAAQSEQGQAFDPDSVAGLIGIGAILVVIMCGYVGHILGGYLALAVLNQLPSDDLLQNVLSLALTFFLAYLVSLIPFVGWIAAIVIVSSRYELGCGGLLAFLFISNVCSTICAIVPFLMIGGSLAAFGELMGAA